MVLEAVYARCGSRRVHPVLFDRSTFDELQQTRTDVGARAVVNVDADRVVYLNVDDPGVVLELDTPADLVRAGLALPTL
jgi:molybdenum cofactor cytidylyltransferase